MSLSSPKIVDLTHSLSGDAPSWDGHCGFHLEIRSDYHEYQGPDFFRVNNIKARAGMGTHLDAPAHCFPGATTIDALKLEDLIADCVVIKVDASEDENYILMPGEVEKWESEHGKIKPGCFVLISTGWNRYWGTPAKYRNSLQFPSVHESAAELLLDRQLVGLGIDTLSPDAKGVSFPVHRLLLGAGKYLVENVAHVNKLPPTGSTIFVMPMKIKDATEAPVRLFAFV